MRKDMPTFTKEAVLNSSPEKIFDILADVERHSDLAGSGEVAGVRKLTEGPVIAGTRFEAAEDVRKSHVFRKRIVTYSLVTRLERPNLIQWRTTAPFRPMVTTLWTYTLKPESNGTRVEVKCNATLKNPILNFLLYLPFRMSRGKALSNRMERTLQESLPRLLEES